MNVVWPVTALFGSVAAVWGYFTCGRLATREKAMERDETPHHRTLTPFPVKVGKGATHCGSDCTLGDICAEWLVFQVPAMAAFVIGAGAFGQMACLTALPETS